MGIRFKLGRKTLDKNGEAILTGACRPILRYGFFPRIRAIEDT